MNDEPYGSGEPRKEVAIFGAGIAGLTAAHELIERGFRVQVFELACPSVWDELAGAPCAVGGMARTQWSRAERPDPSKRLPLMQSTQPIVELGEVLRFKPNSAVLTAEAKNDLKKVACKLEEYPWVHNVEVQGFTDDLSARPYPDEHDDPHWQNRLDYKRAQAVFSHLVDILHVNDKRLTAAALGLGCADDWRAPKEQRNYVTFHVLEDLIPGEHGFRFFPSFYRHLFDTMRRTPIAESDQAVYHESSRTVLDNIIPTKIQRIALNDPEKSFDYVRRPATSLQEVFDLAVTAMKGMGCTFSDAALFQLKLFKYMTSCSERRQVEYENQSWWEFVEGDRYSPRYRQYVDSTGQMLVAARAVESDARSYGNSSVQLLLDQYTQAAQTDGTLSGPTSLAWFDHWRQYLERQGVEFHRAQLESFEILDENTVWPVVKVFGAGENGADVTRVIVRDYYVIAVDVGTAQRLVRGHPRLAGGDFDKIRCLDLGTIAQARPEGALQHMSGIQYYFESDIRFVEGHTDYADAAWGLSSISQPQFWTDRRGWWSGYRGVLSVDICNWFAKSTSPEHPYAAWDSTKTEIAMEVWRQIKATIKPQEGFRIPEPIHYHLDERIKFERDQGRGPIPAKNESPYLINRVGEYVCRPGKPGDYEVLCGSIVFAGTYMQTYTRITTMEAANESARHAVNAILKHSQFLGEPCATYDPETCEPPDLKFLVDLDRRLQALGLPHLVDILDLREVPKALLRPDPDLSAVGLGPDTPGGPYGALLRAAMGEAK